MTQKVTGDRKRARARYILKTMPLSTYVVVSLGLVILYTIAEMIVSTITEVSHDTLTTCFYSVFGGEVVTCGLIKIFKLKREGDFNEG